MDTTFGVAVFLTETGVAAGGNFGVPLAGVFFTDFGVATLGVFLGDGDFAFGVATGGLGVSAIGGTVAAAFGVFFGLCSFVVVTALPGLFLPLGVAGFGVVLFGVSIFTAFLGDTRFGVAFEMAGFSGDTLGELTFGVGTLAALGVAFFEDDGMTFGETTGVPTLGVLDLGAFVKDAGVVGFGVLCFALAVFGVATSGVPGFGVTAF